MIYEFQDVNAAHEFHAHADAQSETFGTARWVGEISGWYPRTYRVEVSDAYEAYLLQGGR